MYPKKLIETSTHGKSVSHLIKTMTGKSKPPEVVTCFGSFRKNIAEFRGYDLKQYFTYSRNDGPIQRVVIDYDTVVDSDYSAIDTLYIKLDVDLCRAQDGESLSFYVNGGIGGITGFSEQVIPDMTNRKIDSPELVPPQMIGDAELVPVQMIGDDSTPYEFAITGISGNGEIALDTAYVLNVKDIAIPHPLTLANLKSGAPRWYPTNEIKPENNKIVIYPSHYTDEVAFDLFEAMGGVGEEPIEIHSCVAAVPNKYECLPNSVVTSQYESAPILHNTMVERPIELTEIQFEPVGMSNYVFEHPFPFCLEGFRNHRMLPTMWPVREEIMYGEIPRMNLGVDYICTFSKNGSARKTIVWNTGGGFGSQHHTVWDAIKELFLDEQGRTAFTLSDFNAVSGRDIQPTVSGISSSAGVSMISFVGDQTVSFTDVASTFEIGDRVIRFAEENEGVAWEETELTIYPTPLDVINSYGFDGGIDYYTFLCDTREKLEVGEPITLHSCAVIEPKNHIRPNTKVIMQFPDQEETRGLSATVKLNDGDIKTFKVEPAEGMMGLFAIFNYINFLGEPLKVVPPSVDGRILPDEYVNKLYFRMGGVGYNYDLLEISGCSGSEYPRDDVQNTFEQTEDGVEEYMVEVLDENSTNIPLERTTNSVTFIKNPIEGYVDFFDMFKDVSGDSHVIYSSAAVPTVVYKNHNGDGDGELPEPPIDPEPIENGFVFDLITEPTQTSVLTLIVSDPDPEWKLLRDGILLASSNYSGPNASVKKHSSFEEYTVQVTGLTSVDTTFSLHGSAEYVRLTTGANDYTRNKVTVTRFSDEIRRCNFSVWAMELTVPEYLPPVVDNLSSMFTSCNAFNQDISMWDVSNVTSMDEMFFGCERFNQDLSSWCVTNIPSLPSGFDANTHAWTLPKPIWGTCPGDDPIADGDTFEFTIDADNTISPNSKIDITLNNVGDNWELLNESGTIATPTYVEKDIKFSERVPSTTITIGNLANRSGDYRLITTCDKISMQSGAGGDSGQVTMRVNVSKFSDTIDSYDFTFPTAQLTVPTTLPRGVTSCEEMFTYCKHFNQDISMWDTSNVTNMTKMFNHTQSFNQSLNTWDVSNVVTMESMFLHAYEFNSEIGDWDVSSVTNMHNLFNAARAFNQDIGNWDVSNVTTMRGMFFDTPHFNQDLSRWCVTNISETPISFTYYENAWTLPKPVWGTCPVAYPPGVPLEFNLTTPVDLTQTEPLTFELEDWGTGWALYEDDVLISNSETMGPGVSHSMGGFNRQIIKIDQSNFANRTVNYKMFVSNKHLNVSREFDESSSLYPSVEVLSFSDTSSRQSLRFAWTDMTVPTVLPRNITSTITMFDGCQRFNQDISMWDTSNVTDMSVMFRNCISFNQPIGVWDVSNVTDMSEMFAGCSSFNQDISGWNVSLVKIIRGMFDGATVFNSDISGWNLDALTDCHVAFKNATTFNQDISDWDTSNVTGMSQMFSGAHSFNQDISKWDVKQVRDMREMFYEAASFNQDLSKWCVTNIPSKPNLFSDGAVAWTKSKPIWGTCPKPEVILPEGTPLEFNVTTSDVASRITVGCLYLGDGWTIYQDNVLVCDATKSTDNVYGGSVNSYKEVEFVINTPVNVTRNYKLYLDASIMNVRAGAGYISTEGRTLEVVKLPESYNAPCFNVVDHNIVMTAHLPELTTSLKNVFNGSMGFNGDITHWDTKNIFNFEYAFYECRAFNQDIRGWNTANSSNMFGMFYGASKFNQDLSGWNVANIPSKPGNFDGGTTDWVLPKPNWGTDGTVVEPPVENTKPESIPGYLEFSIEGELGSVAKPLNVNLNFPDSTWEVRRNGQVVVFDGSDSEVTIDPTSNSNYTRITIATATGAKEFFQVKYTLRSDAGAMLDKVALKPTKYAEPTGQISNFELIQFSTSPLSLSLPSTNMVVPSALPPTCTNLSSLFDGCDLFNQDISGWDTSNVTDMTQLFSGAVSFNQDITGWNVSNVTTMYSMFSGAVSFNQDISTWNTSNVDSMNYMFIGATTFNQDLSGWNVSKIPVKPELFDEGTTAWTLPKPVWGTDGKPIIDVTVAKPMVISFNNNGSPAANEELNIQLTTAGTTDNTWSIKDADGVTLLDSSKLSTTSGDMKASVYSTSIAIKYTNRATQKRDISIHGVFKSIKINTIDEYTWSTSTNITVSDFGEVTDNYYFKVRALPLHLPSVWSSTTTSMEGMFTGSFAINGNLNAWDVSHVTDMNNTFAGSKFNLDISNWNVSGVTNMQGMFNNNKEFNQDLSGWNVSHIPTEPVNFSTTTNAWVKPKPIWGAPPAEKYLPIDVTGASGVYITLSRNGVDYTTFNMSDPSFNQIAFQRFAVVGDDNASFAFVAYPSIIAQEDLLPEDATHGLMLCGLTVDGKVITPRHPNGYTIKNGVILDPSHPVGATEVSSPPLNVNRVNSVIYAKASAGIPKEYDMFYSLTGAVEGGVVKVISNATISFD